MTTKSKVSENRKTVLKLDFSEDRTFDKDLRRRVDAYFKQNGGRSKLGSLQMYLKSALVLTCFVALYVLLVFVAEAFWQGLTLAILLGFSVASIGFCIGHDAGHKAYAKTPWINKLMALSMDLIGGSSYIWFWKHAVIHHKYVNIVGYDTDIDLGVLGRVAPQKKRRWFYRWQHFYLWPLYGLLAIKWEWFDDFYNVITGRIGRHGIPRPSGWDLVIFLGGKLLFFFWAIGLPLLFHPPGVVLFFYGVGALTLGLTISLVFQLPHCVAQAAFPDPGEGDVRMESTWAVHQTLVTLDFARRRPIVSWPLGGLNYHLEHHLFPTVCHIHYPALTRIVEDTCREHGIRYEEHRTFLAGLIEHYRWLRRMGSPVTSQPANLE